MTTFLRLMDVSVEEKPAALSKALSGHDVGRVFEMDPTGFRRVPGSPFAYWIRDSIRALFSNFERLDQGQRGVRVGVATGDDGRFLRLWWEVDCREALEWRPLAKGGSFSRFYADLALVIDWRREGEPIEISFVGARVKKPDFGRPGLTWPARTNGLSIRAMPAGSIFTHKGPAIFFDRDVSTNLLGLAAVMNSSTFSFLIGVQLARTELAQSYEVGLVQQTPVPLLEDNEAEQLSLLARRAWSLKRLLDTTNETSHAFVLPPGTLGYEASPLHPEAGGFNRADIHRQLAEIQAEIDDKVFALYGISDEDRATIEASMSGGALSVSAVDSADDDSRDEGDESDEDDSESTVELTATTLTTYSWLVGVAFGRFDPRLATCKRAIPPEPEPFDPLPARSPGMWPEGEQPNTVPPDIMVDDPGHDHDIRMLVASAAAMTGWPDPEDLRQWLAKELFPLHIKMYSKSRRKAPIYWQLATPSASYSVWLYIHAFTKDTLFRVQNDYVAPKLAHEQRKLESLQAASQDGQTAADRKELAAQESLVEELRAFLDEVKRVAPLWNPNLDDGVIINFSLLWRLVPQHKPWQKELKSTWDTLCAGKYDWAHLAMHLWPERVVPQCAKDRSLAIAHGLEEVFWVEGSDGKWTARKTPTTPISELVQARTSPAVQDALKRLLSAPAPAAGGAKKKAPRKKTVRRSSSTPPGERGGTKKPSRAKG